MMRVWFIMYAMFVVLANSAEPEDSGIVVEVNNCAEDGYCGAIVETIEGEIKCMLLSPMVGDRVPVASNRGELECE